VRRNGFRRLQKAARVCARQCLRGVLVLRYRWIDRPRGWVGRQSAKTVLLLVSHHCSHQEWGIVYTYAVACCFRSSLSTLVAECALASGWVSTLAIRYRYRDLARQVLLCRIGYQCCTRNIVVSSNAMEFVTAYDGSHLEQHHRRYLRARP
jgi:hypothetical protein